jgi:hypothetical protein
MTAASKISRQFIASRRHTTHARRAAKRLAIASLH